METFTTQEGAWPGASGRLSVWLLVRLINVNFVWLTCRNEAFLHVDITFTKWLEARYRFKLEGLERWLDHVISAERAKKKATVSRLQWE